MDEIVRDNRNGLDNHVGRNGNRYVDQRFSNGAVEVIVSIPRVPKLVLPTAICGFSSVKNLAKRVGAVRSRRNDALGKASAPLPIFAREGKCAFDQGWGAGVRKIFCNERVCGAAPKLYRLSVRRRGNRQKRGERDNQSVHGFQP
jgi:hypothetical protein